MKKLLICLVAAIAMSFIATKASIAASQATQTLTTGATVTDTAPVIDITLLKFDGITPNYDDPWANGAKQTNTSLDFGQLTHTYVDDSNVTQEAGCWYSKVTYAVMIYASSFGKRYEIKSTCAGLGSLSKRAFVLTPVYAAGDYYVFPDGSKSLKQGNMPSGAAVGDACSAVGTNLLIYRSESPGTKKIIQAWYSIPTTKIKVNGVTKLPYADYDKDKDPISLDQIAGSYSGSVTITISAI